MERRFVSVEEFAIIFGVSGRLVYDLIKRGAIPVVELGRRRLIPTQVIEAIEARALDGFDPVGALRELEAS